MSGDWTDIPGPSTPSTLITSAHIATGPVIPPQQRLLTYSYDQWEDFVQEWLHYCLRKNYKQINRFTGSGDMGVDVVGFVDDKRLEGVWDNYQCKHYDQALTPGNIWVEIGKVVWYSFNKKYAPPRRYYFVAPRGAGTKLSRLLSNATDLRSELLDNWDKSIKNHITSTQEVRLDAKLLAYVNAFDFSIFESKTALQLVEDHRETPVHAARFGGGLPARPAPNTPPIDVALKESQYISQLLGAYAEHAGSAISDPADIPLPKLKSHFNRQREAFYQAESLRVFARDNVPKGTFESLQQDVYTGVIDTHDSDHVDGFQKVCAVTKAARDLEITANALISCTNPQDRDGICHQLVNEERLRWTK